MKHTPGPWEIDRFSFRGELPYLIATKFDVICLFQQHNRIRVEDVEANAHLIAAAPDLLAACEKAKQFITNGVELGYIRLPDKPDPALDTLPQICAAIAKAEGSS